MVCPLGAWWQHRAVARLHLCAVMARLHDCPHDGGYGGLAAANAAAHDGPNRQQRGAGAGQRVPGGGGGGKTHQHTGATGLPVRPPMAVGDWNGRGLFCFAAVDEPAVHQLCAVVGLASAAGLGHGLAADGVGDGSGCHIALARPGVASLAAGNCGFCAGLFSGRADGHRLFWRGHFGQPAGQPLAA